MKNIFKKIIEDISFSKQKLEREIAKREGSSTLNFSPLMEICILMLEPILEIE